MAQWPVEVQEKYKKTNNLALTMCLYNKLKYGCRYSSKIECNLVA